MRVPEKQLLLKDGTICALRSPGPWDAARRIAFFRQVNAETEWLARGASDSPGDEAMVAEMLDDQLEDAMVIEVAAFIGGEMAASGCLSPLSRGYPRKRHRAQLGVCVRKDFWGRGIAGAILEMLIGQAPGMGFSQIELSVAAGNHRARRLYERFGFSETGWVPDALRYEDGSTSDEIWMMKKV